MIVTKKKQLRRELYALLQIDDNWHKYPESELYKKITALGEQLSDEAHFWKERTIDKERYLYYLNKGCTFVDIAKKFDVTVNTLRAWRQKNNLL